MTPKEKSQDLLAKMDVIHYHKLVTQPQCKGLPVSMHDDQIKQCALICCDEIIQAIDFDWMEVQNLDREHAYWNEVKEEINKL